MSKTILNLKHFFNTRFLCYNGTKSLEAESHRIGVIRFINDC